MFGLAPAVSFSGSIDGGAGNDTVAGANTATDFSINSLGSGSVAAASFNSVENLRGGSGADRFIFNTNGSLGGTVDGGGGIDELLAADRTNAWRISGVGAGQLNASAFTGIETLTGNSDVDTFRLDAGISTFGGTINGGSGDDVLATIDGTNAWIITSAGAGRLNGTTIFTDIKALVGGTGTDTLFGPNSDQTWTLTGANTGHVDDLAFTSMENLTGAGGLDAFVVESAGGLSGTLDGGTGSDILLSQGAGNMWRLESSNAGSVAGVKRFAGIENLKGGNGDDEFVFLNTGASVDGRIDGGGGANTLNYSAFSSTTSITVDFSSGLATGTGGIAAITRVIGGQSTSDKLVGPDADVTWHLTGENAGDVAQITFEGIENLSGASGNDDTFVLTPGGKLSAGVLDGGIGGYDKLVFDLGNGQLVTYAPTGSESGSVTQGGRAIDYRNLEFNRFYLSDFSEAANITITGNPISGNDLSLTSFTTDMVQIRQGNSPESIAFHIPSQSLTIVMGGLMDNTLSIGTAVTPIILPGSLTIRGGGFDDNIVLAGSLTLGKGLSINGSTGNSEVSLNGALTIHDGGFTIDDHLGFGHTVLVDAPVSVNGDVVILGGVLADTVSIDASVDIYNGGLVIDGTLSEADKWLGLDAVTINGGLNTHGGDFSVDAATISVGPVTVSTNPDTAGGHAGAISLTGQTILIGAGSKLLAQGGTAGAITLSVSVYDPSGALPIDVAASTDPSITVLSGAEIRGGAISLTAEKTSQAQLLPLSLLSLQQKSAKVIVEAATIDGSRVEILANAEDSNPLESFNYNIVNNLALTPLLNLGFAAVPPILSAVSY